MKYKHIVFDVDGTLLDTEKAILLSLQDTVLEFTGKTMPIESLTFSLGIPGVAALEQLNIQDTMTALRFWEKVLQSYGHHYRIFSGIETLLQALTERGYRLGIVTSKTKEQLGADLSLFPIGHYFSTIVSATDTQKHKPNPDPLLKYMEKAGCTKDTVLYVGDSIYDRKCAQGAGCDFAVALWGAQGPMENVYNCPSPMALLAYIEAKES